MVVLALAGCYGPTVQFGLPCSDDGSCPVDQTCDLTLNPPLCVAMLGDGGLGPDGHDAPQACSAGCDGDTPVCDPDTQSCRGCIADSECPSDVCHELIGECVAEGKAIYVAPNGTDGNCTRNAPCGRFNTANQQRTAMRNTIKVASGVYMDRLELRIQNGSSSLVISGPDRTWTGPQLTPNIGAHRIIDQNLTVVIEGVSMIDASQDGLESLGSVTLSHVRVSRSGESGVVGRGLMTRILDSRIEGSMTNGVVITNGTVSIERTVIAGNRGGGLVIESGAAYSVINTIIASNGTSTSSNGGVRIAGVAPAGALAVFRFNTVAGNLRTLGTANGLDCGRPVVVESTIVANPVALVQMEMSTMCSARTSLFATTAPAGGGNLMGDPMFVSATDFHVLPGSPAVNAAPAAGAPLLDVDGEPRSGADLPDIGADEVP